MKRLLVLCTLVAALFVGGRAHAGAPEPWVQRVVAMGELWGAVRYLHPRGGERASHWERAFLGRVRAAMDAKDDAAYRRAIASMLDSMEDPATRVVESDTAMPTTKHGGSGSRWSGTTLILAFGDGFAFRDETRRAGVAEELARADRVVVDLRGTTELAENDLERALSQWAPALVPRAVESPTLRCVVHTGWVPQTFETSGGYYSSLRVLAADDVTPVRESHPRRVVFLLGEASPVPWLAIALQAEGGGGLVAPADLGVERFVPTRDHDLPHGVRAKVRTCDLVHRGRGLVGLPVDRRASGEKALDVALALARSGGKPRRPRFEAEPPSIKWRADETWAELDVPPLEHRLFAAIRLHQIIARFFPYVDLADDWDGALVESLPRFRDAKDGRAYAETVLRMAARIGDSHVHVRGGRVREVIGHIPPPVRLRMIEGKPTVVRVLDEASAKLVAIGDVVVSVDGERMVTRMAALRPYVAASTEARMGLQTANQALHGPEGKEAELVIERAGKTRTVRLPRERTTSTSDRGPAWRILDGGIGYVNLMSLERQQVPKMFDALIRTKAIVFDMRGYPKGTAWSIVPHIALAGHVGRIGSQYLCNEVSMFGGKRYLDYRVPAASGPKYRGRIVMLIDEEAISQSEMTAMYFDAANHVTFVGSPTAGANGDVTELGLPGGLYVTFTGQSASHGDGRRLQRLGVQPHVRAAPTIAGLRAGKDEVLERALRLLRAPSAVKRAR
jgi:C-terminal processing protease CtpA/Prc